MWHAHSDCSAVAPRLVRTLCAAGPGRSGCSDCADVCPHAALGFDGGPSIDADACRRCGACVAACPTGALVRDDLPPLGWLPLLDDALAAHPGARLVACCSHDCEPATDDPTAILLRLPCVNHVSTELMLAAIAGGAGSFEVRPDADCPNAPHVGPERARARAAEALAGWGLDPHRVAFGSRASTPPSATAVSRAPATPRRTARVDRTAELIGFLADGATPVPSTVAQWWHVPTVAADSCTMCGACAVACPTRALGLADGGATLVGDPARCIGCKKCEQVCPEHAVAVASAVPDGKGPRRLAHAPLAACERCGRSLGPEPMVARVESLLRSRFGALARSARVCEPCKAAAAPTPAGPLPIHPAPRAAPPAPEGTTRREALALLLRGTAAASLALAGGCAAPPPADPARHRYGMVIDTRRCVGCKACVVACKVENLTPPGVNYMLVTENTLGNLPDDKPLFTAKPCFHCEHPPCVDVCPVSATFKRGSDGIVVVDYDRCIGCRYCMTACPYGSRFFDFGEHYDFLGAEPTSLVPSPEYGQYRLRREAASPIGNVRKCTFCLHLQDDAGAYDKAAGRWPACAKTCTGHAIHFGDFLDSESDVARLVRERQPVRLKEELGAEPNVHYLL